MQIYEKKLLLAPRGGVVEQPFLRRRFRQTGRPDLERGASVMNALPARQSIRSFSEKTFSQKDLSDLLWAANGLNRHKPPGRQNYICTKDGTDYLPASQHEQGCPGKGSEANLFPNTHALPSGKI